MNTEEKYEKPTINVVNVEIEKGVAASQGKPEKGRFGIQDVVDGGNAW